MHIALITQREDQLTALKRGLEHKGCRVACYPEGSPILASARQGGWDLIVLDALSTPFRPFLESLMDINAFLNSAVVTDLAPEAFHEATEGLGILCGLPAQPTEADAAQMLEQLQSLPGFQTREEEAQASLDTLKQTCHPDCVVCSSGHPFGLKVDYRALSGNRVEGIFPCDASFQGYQQILHGGIVSSLLDGAMASCMLAKGIEAYTVELTVRFRSAVTIGTPATIQGTWLKGEGPLHLLQARLEQNGKLCASARAKFFEGNPRRPEHPLPRNAVMRQTLRAARKERP